MVSMNVTTARKNLYKIVSDVNNFGAPVEITSSSGKNAVLISADDWNAIQETLYLHSVPGLEESIIEARKERLEDCAAFSEDEEW